MKKFLILLLVFCLANMASAYPEADFEDLTVGVISGQGGGSGWSDDWVDSSSFAVVQETGNKYMSHAGQAATKYMNRSVTPFSSNAYSFWHEVRFSTPIGANVDEWGSITCTEIQFRDASGTYDPIHIKYEPTSKYLRVGNENMLDLGSIYNETTAGTFGGGAEADYWKDPVGNWCKVLLAVDADAVDKSNAIAVYWELNNGSMGYVGDGTIQEGDETTVISNIKFGSKLGNGVSVDFDNLEIVGGLVPEPATIMMLGLGGLTLIRKRR